MTAQKLSIDPVLLAKSQAYCAALTRQAAKNFYYGLKLLPEPKRTAMYTLYGYMRLVDDIADDETNRTAEQRLCDLLQWRDCTHAAIAGDPSKGHIVWPAFAELVRRYRIPAKLFDDMIDGQRQDLTGGGVAIATFADLHAYCYRVASVVGLASLYVWGVEQGTVADVEALGIDRGIAFQLTNVLRDLKEDAARGRCYVPREDLERFGVKVEEIAAGKVTPGFVEMMRFEVERAEGFYARSAVLEGRVRADSRPTLRAMTGIYYGLLQQITVRPERVLRQRISLSTWAKLRIGWRAMRGR